MNPRGGTEILWSNFCKYVNKSLRDRVNIILSDCRRELLRQDVPNILWHHVDTNQAVARGLSDPEFVGRLSKIVFVSDWQKQKHIKEFNLPENICTVLLNAVEPVEFVPKPKSAKLKLIYTSTPWRGLELLVESFKLLNRHDVELDVYSSTVIYGVNFMKNEYEWLFNRCRQTPGINYRGYAANKAVIKAGQSAHIFSYPSVFAETSCLAAIEAGITGCKILTTDLGALPETCGIWAKYVDYDENYQKLIANYAEALYGVIDNYWSNQESLYEQHLWFNKTYNWVSRADEWNNLLKQYV
jgi:UDP-glucose:(glucosyl)LPS alpha-1,2-glucosyltransferase